MSNWIIILGAFLGSGLICEVVMYFIKRHNANKDANRDKLLSIIDKISSYGKVLIDTLNEWIDCLKQINIILNDKIELTKKFKQKFDQFDKEEIKLYDEHRACFCALAPNCPKRIAGDLPDDIEEFFSKYRNTIQKYETEINNLRARMVEQMTILENHLSSFTSIRHNIPELYSVKRTYFKALYNKISKLDNINLEIISQIKKYKTMPNLMIEEEMYIEKPIFQALTLVENIKLDISKLIY